MAGLKDGTAAMDVYQSVRNAIMHQQFKPGTSLTENALCAYLKVGRSPVRAALQALADEGYVELLPNRGAYVAEFTQKQIRQLYAIRELILSHALDVAIDDFTQEDLDLLQQCLLAQEEAFRVLDSEKYISSINLFYSTIIAKAGNSYLNEIAASILNRLGVYCCLYDNFYSVKKLKSLPLHYNMLEGIQERKAAKVIRNHRKIVEQNLDAYDYMVTLNVK